MKKFVCGLLTVACLTGLTGCGDSTSIQKAGDTEEVANDYYIDLTELGMKLTIYLRLDGKGNFLFSNTLDFEVNKSSGTFQKSGEEYIMVYNSVNGEEKSVSDGLTSGFVVTEEGSLDFTVCEQIYYGSAGATTVSENNPEAKLVAYVVPENFEEPGLDSEFQAETYTAITTAEDGTVYTHTASFYEDNSYLISTQYGQSSFFYEAGIYGVSTSQLALTPEDAESEETESEMSGRVECEIVDSNHLKMSILASAGAKERTQVDFTKTENTIQAVKLSGTAKEAPESFETTFIVYTDGSYESSANGFTERGLLVIDTENGYVKQYPDHPETGARGLTQVATVPSGTSSNENGKLTLGDLRIRISEDLSRYKCTVTE
ncbi:MAG: hypothetical protein U0L05_07520 [Schaedlerella sp.]|nr:hypothetical protein [Schaedlerella sp.]